MKSRSRLIHPVLGLVVIALLAGGSARPALGQGLLDLFMSPEKESQIGAEQHPQILQEFGGVYEDQRLVPYVVSIGQFLAQTTGAKDTRFTFTVLNNPIVNAFALPGGYVYVTRGLVALAENEAELAGVLAHEIGHVVARHGANRQSKNVLAGLGLAILGAVTDSSLANNLAGVGALAVVRGYSREDEFEADSLGVQYMSRAGFAPEGMSSFLQKLEAHGNLESRIRGGSGSGGFDFMSTHPRTGDRVARAVAAAGATRVDDPIVARDIYLDKIDGMIFGDDPAQGIIDGRRFVHPALRFEFTVPAGFTLLNGKDSVLARGPEGTAIRLDTDRRRDRIPMLDYVRRVWAPKARLEGLQETGINGMEAATAITRVSSGRGQTADLRLLAIAFDSQSIFRFMFITPPRLTSSLDREIRRTAFSFRRISEADAAAIRGLRVRIHRIRSGETVHSLASRMALREHGLERFLILNGLSDRSRLATGLRVKLVGH